MLAFNHCHYVPALKWKRGEARAIRDVNLAGPISITPLAEIVPQPWDWDLDEPTRAIEAHLDNQAQSIAGHWATQRPIIADTLLLDPALRMASGDHPVRYLAYALQAKGIACIPATGPERDLDHVTACAAVYHEQNTDVCIRLMRDDLADPQISARLDFLLQSLRATPDRVHLVLDLRDVNESTLLPFASLAAVFINNIVLAQSARTLTVLSGAFPENVSGFGRGMNAHPRSDWRMWLAILRSTPVRLPAFGDYAIAHPELVEIDPRYVRMSASIRYTAIEQWLVPRGYAISDARRGGAAQYHDLAQQLQVHPHFSGRGFSVGDAFIDDVANKTIGPGNAEQWRWHPTNHHLQYVLSQLASFYGP